MKKLFSWMFVLTQSLCMICAGRAEIPVTSVGRESQTTPSDGVFLQDGGLNPDYFAKNLQVRTNAAFRGHLREPTRAPVLQDVLNKMSIVQVEVLDVYNRNALKVRRGTKGSYYAYYKDTTNTLEYNYLFTSVTGKLVSVSVRNPRNLPSDLGYRISFYPNGSVKEFFHNRDGIRFRTDGHPERFFTRVENNKIYLLKWNERGEVIEERTKKRTAELLDPSKDFHSVQGGTN